MHDPLVVAVAGDIGPVRLPARQTPATERPVHIPGTGAMFRFDTMRNHRPMILEPPSNMRAVLVLATAERIGVGERVGGVGGEHVGP